MLQIPLGKKKIYARMGLLALFCLHNFMITEYGLAKEGKKLKSPASRKNLHPAARSVENFG
jgi:hypothetical protein